MQKFSTFRRFMASCTALTLVMSSVPGAFAQTSTVTTTKAEAPKVEASTEAHAEPAGPSPEQQSAARASFEAGKKAYDEEDFVTAEAEFKKAQAVIPSPHAEYWIASSLDKQGKDAASIVTAYETFLSNPGASHLGEEKLEEARTRVAELKKGLPAQYTFTTDPAGAAVRIDGVAQTGLTPLQVELTAGIHKIEATLEGYETTSAEIQVEGGSRVEQPLILTAIPVVEPVALDKTAAAEAPERSLVPAYVTLGLGTAGLIAGTVFGILAVDAKSQFNDMIASGGVSRDSILEKADEVERNALIADMSFGIALTLGITGVVLLTSSPEAATADKTTAQKGGWVFAPFASRNTGGAAARFTF